MFGSLFDRLTSVFDKLRGRGALSELDVRAAMREVRIALLEADVALPVVKDFVDAVTARAVGAEVTRSVTPGQQVATIVRDRTRSGVPRWASACSVRAFLGGEELGALAIDAR